MVKNLKDNETVFTPLDVIKSEAKRRNVPVDFFKVPEGMIVTFQTVAFKFVQERFEGEPKRWFYGDAQPLQIVNFGRKKIGVIKCWIGAPAAAMTLEELIACGANKIIEVGMAGGIQDYLQLGEIVVVKKALRDEGTSLHYFPSEKEFEPSEKLRERLIKILMEKKLRYRVGSVWTTDGVYRETKSKFLKFRELGVLGVNMETSALFAVAKYRNVQIASIQVISDILSEKGWLPAFSHVNVVENLKKAIEHAIECLAEI